MLSCVNLFLEKAENIVAYVQFPLICNVDQVHAARRKMNEKEVDSVFLYENLLHPRVEIVKEGLCDIFE